MHQVAQRHQLQEVIVHVTKIKLLWRKRTSQVIRCNYMGQYNKHEGQEEEHSPAYIEVLGCI